MSQNGGWDKSGGGAQWDTANTVWNSDLCQMTRVPLDTSGGAGNFTMTVRDGGRVQHYLMPTSTMGEPEADAMFGLLACASPAAINNWVRFGKYGWGEVEVHHGRK